MLLPLHPQPRQHEVLSSWMVRLALINGYPLHTFYSNLLKFKAPIWNRDTDRHPSQELVHVLSRCSGVSVAALQALTMTSYEGLLFERLPMIGNAPWVLPVGVIHRKRRRGGMQYCPLCLLSDQIPYYRKHWRLALYAVCERHHCVMQEYCPQCHEVVAYHRHGIGRGTAIPEDALVRCHKCGCDLSQVEPSYLEWPDVASMQALEDLLCRVVGGEGGVPFPSFSSELAFFTGRHALASLINGRYGQKLRKNLGGEFGVSIGVGASDKRSDFEDQNSFERLKLLLAIEWLLIEWPHRFVAVCGASDVTRYRLLSGAKRLPFWLAAVGDEYLDNRPYLPNPAEAIAAGNYLAKHGQPVTTRTLGSILGVSRDVARSASRAWLMHNFRMHVDSADTPL